MLLMGGLLPPAVIDGKAKLGPPPDWSRLQKAVRYLWQKKLWKFSQALEDLEEEKHVFILIAKSTSYTWSCSRFGFGTPLDNYHIRHVNAKDRQKNQNSLPRFSKSTICGYGNLTDINLCKRNEPAYFLSFFLKWMSSVLDFPWSSSFELRSPLPCTKEKQTHWTCATFTHVNSRRRQLDIQCQERRVGSWVVKPQLSHARKDTRSGW